MIKITDLGTFTSLKQNKQKLFKLEIINFRIKALEAPSIVKMEKQA